jgi:hypothetical protein
MKLAHLLPSIVADFRVILAAYSVDLATADHGPGGLKTMWQMLGILSRNRAYDDTHPGFASGQWKRVLPFDGREYCFYYAGGANDDHAATLLRAAKKELLKS